MIHRLRCAGFVALALTALCGPLLLILAPAVAR